MTLEVGDSVPVISALNQDGDEIEVSFEQPTVIYFYPRDKTPGCTTEANQFNAELETYTDGGVSVYGVSTDSVESHASFASDCQLDFDLLADPDHTIADVFGVDTTGDRAARTTFVVDGREVKAVYSNVEPNGHARSVLSDIIDSGLVTIEW